MISRTEYRFLKWAVGRAEEWRGSLTGDPDPEPLAQFDANVKETRRILKKLWPKGRQPARKALRISVRRLPRPLRAAVKAISRSL